MNKTVLTAGIISAVLFFGIAGSKAYAQEASQPEAQQPAQVVVEVQKGDSLSKIAKANDSTYQRLFYANVFIAHPDVIHPGEQIRIPSSDEELAERPMPEKVARVSSIKPKVSSSKKVSSRKQNVAQAPAANVDGGVWDRLAACESGGNWSINTGNGYYGGVQFSAATWRSVGGTGLPHQNSKAEQIKRAEILQARSGWGQWPHCSSKLGLR
ncbi:transglycosylase family protein [Candidatus Saccharibacteria bacterium]|nr:transglycosylase family protein [Candidatus Saccharibacteria bacterium]